MKLSVIGLRNISRNKRRSILSGFAIAIVAMVITFMFSMENGMMSDLKNNVFKLMLGHFRIRNSQYDANEQLNPLEYTISNAGKLDTLLINDENIRAVAPRIPFPNVIYGSPTLSQKDIKDMPEFISQLKDSNEPLPAFLRENLPGPGKRALEGLSGDGSFDKQKLVTLMDALNRVLTFKVIYSPERFAGITLPDEVKKYAVEDVRFENRISYNRELLDSAMAGLVKPNLRGGKLIPVMGVGCDFVREKSFYELDKALIDGELPAMNAQAREVVLPAGLADQLNLTVGDKLTLTVSTPGGLNAATFRIKGIVRLAISTYNTKFFFIPLDTAQNFLKMDDRVIEMLVMTKNLDKLAPTITSVSGKIQDAGFTGLTVKSWEEIDNFAFYIQYADVAYAFIALFFFLLGTTVIINTTMMVIYERMREIGTVSAMGMTGSEIVRMFFLESFFISVIASFIGVVIGFIVVLILNHTGINFTEYMNQLDFPMAPIIYPSINPLLLVFIFVYSVSVASFASFIPSRRAAKIEPVKALRAI
ncbi:MAG: ABC transporter permease [Spirochaetales bacterium]|nr:ABC transporter permease [Spirochaetales bacterium]